MITKPGRLFIMWLLASGALATLLAAFAWIVDPYSLFDIPRISHFNARKPALIFNDRLIKAYEVVRAKPNTVLIGTSMVGVGLDAGHPAWPASYHPIYNLALAGSGLYTSYRYLQHAMSYHEINLVVLGLDFEYFLDVPDYFPIDADFESRLAVTAQGMPNRLRERQYDRDLLRSILTLDALSDSVATVAGNLSGKAQYVAAGNYPDTFLRQILESVGSYTLVMAHDLHMFQRYGDKELSPRAMSSLQDILALCQSHGTKVILLINPAHANELETRDLLGQWAWFENWKRELVALTEKYATAASADAIALWDFSDYNVYSTEDISASDAGMRWFWDSVHYRRALGDLIIERLLGATAPQDLGVRLRSENIESHLAEIRTHQRLYRMLNPARADYTRRAYVLATGRQPPNLPISRGGRRKTLP